jgi:hypothetical protein
MGHGAPKVWFDLEVVMLTLKSWCKCLCGKAQHIVYNFRYSTSEIHIAHGDALWQNQTKHIRRWNKVVSMRSIDIKEANAPSKSAKVLV